MAKTALLHEPSEAHESGRPPPLRVDREGFALLRDRLQRANAANAQFDEHYERLMALLREALDRLESEFGSLIDSVVASGDWARDGVDLRNLRIAEIVLLIVVRRDERPFSLYLDISRRVFVPLDDHDFLIQFGLATMEEWRSRSEFARQRGNLDALGIPVLTRAG